MKKTKKIKVRWFSKVGKLLFKIILGIIITFFCAIWIFNTIILYNQGKEYNTGYKGWFPSHLDIFQTIIKNHWIAISDDTYYKIDNKRYGWFIENFVVLKSQKWMDWKNLWFMNHNIEDSQIINIDNSFTQWEWTWGKVMFLKMKYDSKFFNSFWDPTYSNQKKLIWRTFHELKIEITDTKSIRNNFEIANNSNYKHIWQNSSQILVHSFMENMSKPMKKWETKCVILTPLDKITKEIINAHDKNCDFWMISGKPWFDESYLEILTPKIYDNLPTIKISHITVELPVYQ